MKKANKDALRAEILGKLMDFAQNVYEEALQTSNGSFDTPIVDADGEEGFATISVVIRGKDREGNAYDGYAESEAFLAEQAEKEAAAMLKAVEKACLDAEKEARRLEKEAKKAAKEQAPKA